MFYFLKTSRSFVLASSSLEVDVMQQQHSHEETTTQVFFQSKFPQTGVRRDNYGGLVGSRAKFGPKQNRVSASAIKGV